MIERIYLPPTKLRHTDAPCAACAYAQVRRTTLAGRLGVMLVRIGVMLVRIGWRLGGYV